MPSFQPQPWGIDTDFLRMCAKGGCMPSFQPWHLTDSRSRFRQLIAIIIIIIIIMLLLIFSRGEGQNQGRE